MWALVPHCPAYDQVTTNVPRKAAKHGSHIWVTEHMWKNQLGVVIGLARKWPLNPPTLRVTGVGNTPG